MPRDLTEVIAGLQAMRAAPEPEAAAAPAAAVEAAPVEDAEAAPDVEAQAAAEPLKEPEPVIEPETDPALAKRLAQVQAAEAKKMAAVDAARKKFEAERAAFEAERKELLEARNMLEALRGKKHDPAALLMELGYDEESLEHAARQVYGMSKAAAADPKNRDAAARLAREREQMSALDAVKAELAAVKQQMAAAQQQQAGQQALKEYQAALAQAAATAPVTAKELANPKYRDRAHRALAALALEMAQEEGDVPDAADVVARYEKRRAEELADLAASDALPPAPAAKKAAAPRSMPATGAATPPPPASRALTHEQRKQEAIAGLSSLK